VETGDGTGDHVSHWHRNPDGPEAATEIERLRLIAEERESLLKNEIKRLRLTDEEREAVENMLHLIATKHDDYGREAHYLRSLLERIGSPPLACGTTREVQNSQGAET
jgi:hypothetical protein